MISLSKNELKELSLKLAEKIKADTLRLTAFWESSLCKKMIEDLKKDGKQLDTEEFAYFPNRVKENLDWNDISNEDVKTFVEVMNSSSIGDSKIKEGTTEFGFGEITLEKEGLEVVTIIGQGSITLIRALSK